MSANHWTNIVSGTSTRNASQYTPESVDFLNHASCIYASKCAFANYAELGCTRRVRLAFSSSTFAQ